MLAALAPPCNSRPLEPSRVPDSAALHSLRSVFVSLRCTPLRSDDRKHAETGDLPVRKHRSARVLDLFRLRFSGERFCLDPASLCLRKSGDTCCRARIQSDQRNFVLRDEPSRRPTHPAAAAPSLRTSLRPSESRAPREPASMRTAGVDFAPFRVVAFRSANATMLVPARLGVCLASRTRHKSSYTQCRLNAGIRWRRTSGIESPPSPRVARARRPGSSNITAPCVQSGCFSLSR